MKLYHCRHTTYKVEHEFLSKIYESIPSFEFINQNYNLSTIGLNKELDISNLISLINKDFFLPKNKKRVLISVLNELPSKILIVQDLRKITVDFVFDTDNGLFFFELHENQHKKLTGTRASFIYLPDDVKYVVPRFVQRFLRDIWRVQRLPNYNIVWDDWLYLNKTKMDFSFKDKFHEMHLPGSFSFANFLMPNNAIQ